ncbi:EAL domain-containing protein [Brucepastera parasyntrophica]|uniref:EAL domain-containing protein n=1 Tax=Brucepastera parasyntrophica TaxID=2880008 RepID=UPI002109A570|nr:EAL domain-containing protein [Brucepastera parasyntrophica]ULQ60333.1 EAL domain-containing protein [Brucepastera parasyntrophica]
MENEEKLLSDYISTDYLQWIQDRFSEITKISANIFDHTGKVCTEQSNLPAICKVLLASECTDGICSAVINGLCSTVKETGEQAFAACPHTGLMLGAVPILVNRVYMGCWLIGQIKTAETLKSAIPNPEEAPVRKTSETAAMISLMPVMSKEQFRRILDFLQRITMTLLEMNISIQQLWEFITSNDFATYITDCKTGLIIEANESFARQVGLPIESVIGNAYRSVTDNFPDKFRPCMELISGKTKDTKSRVFRYYNERLHKWFRCSHQIMEWFDGKKVYIITQLDVSKEHELEKELSRLAYYDSLLHLPNYLKLENDLQNNMAGDSRQYLICFDILSLHHFNAIYGCSAGDELLRQIASWLADLDIVSSDLYRIDGDMFCLLIRETAPDVVTLIAKLIQKQFSMPWIIPTENEPLTCFCGAAVCIICVDRNTDTVNLRKRIEDTLAVSRHEKPIITYDAVMDSGEKEKQVMAVKLKNAILNNMSGFDVYYQPIVEFSSGTWTALEALCRWKSPDSGIVSPQVFIPAAERFGLISTLGEWVLEKAVGKCKELGLDNSEDFFLSVNVSPSQIIDESFADKVIEILYRHHYPGEKLNLEVTRGFEFKFNAFSRSVIDKLKMFGITIALDDFGTDYSSFENLKNFPVHYLKTEQKFVQGIEKDSYLQYFLYMMFELSHSHKMKLIAEGIETNEQLEVILQSGADYLQGFLFSGPLSSDDLENQKHNFTEKNEILQTHAPKYISLEKWFKSRNYTTADTSLFKLLHQCTQVLMSEQQPDISLYQVLENIGTHFDISRTFIFLKEKGLPCKNALEWCNTDVSSRKYLMTKDNFELMAELLLPDIKKDGIIISSGLRGLPAELISVFEMADARSVVIVPMWDNNELIGFAGFIHTDYRNWQPEELVMFWNLTLMARNMLISSMLKTIVKFKTIGLLNVLNTCALNAFISDVETDEIIWVNDTVKSRYGIGNEMLGRKCYDVLQGRSKRCPNCRIPELLERNDGGVICYEHFNDYHKRKFIIYESVILWEGKKMVHIEYSYDITESSENYEKVADAIKYSKM